MTQPTHVSGAIKPLEWVSALDNCGDNWFHSDLPDYYYEVGRDRNGWWWSGYNTVTTESKDVHATPEAAKAAAQADYEARIAAQIQPVPDAQPVAWRLLCLSTKKNCYTDCEKQAAATYLLEGWTVTPLYAQPVASSVTDLLVRVCTDAVTDANTDNRGFWRSCPGCHELNEGVPTGPYHPGLKCYIGLGCHECGGIGANWDTTDYAEMGEYLALVSHETPVSDPQPALSDEGDAQASKAGKVLPCPFCGTTPKKIDASARHVWCRGCNADGPLSTDATTAWKRRPRRGQRGRGARLPDGFMDLINESVIEAHKAMRRWPQPNYVLTKFAEEAGEVLKAAIHYAEGRETREAVIGEMRQVIAMMLRLWIEGDQVHGLRALTEAGE